MYDVCKIFRKIFRKIHQGPQVLWMGPKGPPAGAGGCNPPQELEKAREAGYFSCLVI